MDILGVSPASTPNPNNVSNPFSSAIDIFRMLLRMKISNLSQAMFGQYIDLALESAANSSSATVRLGALEFLETSILVFPSAVSMKLSEIRDSIRYVLVNAIGAKYTHHFPPGRCWWTRSFKSPNTRAIFIP